VLEKNVILMNLDIYQYETNASFLDFEFESKGPKGNINKVARFQKIGQDLFNFGFGDLNILTGEINDIIVSNNGDGDRILATVSRIIFEFTDRFPTAMIFIKGSSPGRTRRYQMGLNKYWLEIEETFEVFGSQNDKWENFRQGINYDAFLGKRKTSL
jgi:hypothetical protein